MVECCVGVPWRANGHFGEVEVLDGVGGDRRGNRVLLPLLIRLADQGCSAKEAKANNSKPSDLSRLCLRGILNVKYTLQ